MKDLGISKQCGKCKAYFFTHYETDNLCNDCMPRPETFNSMYLLNDNNPWKLNSKHAEAELIEEKYNTFALWFTIIYSICLLCYLTFHKNFSIPTEMPYGSIPCIIILAAVFVINFALSKTSK